MRKGVRRLLIALIIVFAVAGGMAALLFGGMGAIRRMPAAVADLSSVADGAYRGSFSRGRWRFEVEATVADHKIQALRRLDSPEEPLATAIIERILAEQSVSIDTVSGASITTKALAKAVENALTARK